MKTSKKEIKNTEDKFSKEQIVKSKRFRNNVDLLNAVLKESKQIGRAHV